MTETTKADRTTHLIELVLQGVNALIATYTSVSVARLKAEVFAAAYSAHIAKGMLPEEARSVARATADYMYTLVEAK